MVLIKKDVNKFLLLLIIVLVLVFIWSTAYYENALKNVSIQYDKNLKKLQEATGKVVLENINETVQLKETYQKDKEFFEQKYYELNTENEELKREKDRLQSGLNSVKSELEDTKNKFNILQNQFQQVQNSLITANEHISRLIARVNELCQKLKSYNPDEKC